MGEVSIRELRNQGGQAVDRVAKGEHLIVTRDGEPVAELRPLPRRRTSTAVLIERRAHLPVLDPGRLRADLDAILDTSL